MADSGIFRLPQLQGWQRESIMAAAAFMRERYGNPPGDTHAKVVHDGLLEVLDPSRRAVRLQREMSAAARAAALTAKQERRAADRRRLERRKATAGPAAGAPDRRAKQRRAGADRRTKR